MDRNKQQRVSRKPQLFKRLQRRGYNNSFGIYKGVDTLKADEKGTTKTVTHLAKNCKCG